MSPLMMLLSFMLPLLIAAVQTVNGDDLHTLFPSDPRGDILNVTQCYCQNSTPLSPNATFGYYYLIDYYNVHAHRSFSMEMDCTSPAPDNSLGRDSKKCMDHIRKLEKKCVTYTDNNKFCFTFKEKVDNSLNHSLPSGSKYRFNGQKRRVPAKASDILAADDVRKDCEFYCDEKLGGLKTFETSSSLIPGFGPVTNSIVSYSDLDDMCDTCA